MEGAQSDLQVVRMADPGGDGAALPSGISVAEFDYSVENHFKAMDNIFKLSGESEFDYDQFEIQRLTSSVSFVREWRHFCYQPRAIRFACQSEIPPWKDVVGGINLPQFSSASVPKDISDGNKVSSHLSKDFVMHVGGLVWALDWCPRVHQRPDCDLNVEFIVVAAHPPESSYHKIGASLTGRGVIQIWCLVNAGVRGHGVISRFKEKSKKNPRNNKATKLKETQPKRPRGRPRKNPISGPDNLDGYNQQHIRATEIKKFKSIKPDKPLGIVRKKKMKDSVDNLDSSNQHVQPLAVAFPEVSYKLLSMDRTFLENPEIVAGENSLRNHNSLQAGISTEVQQQDPRGSASRNVKSCDQRKPGKPQRKHLKEPVDNLNGGIGYLESLPVELLEDSSKTNKLFLQNFEEVSGADACLHQNAPVGVSMEQQLRSGSTEAVFCNSRRPDQPKGSPRNIQKKMLVESGKDSSRKRKGCNKGYSEKVVLTSKSRLKKCKSSLKSQVNGSYEVK